MYMRRPASFVVLVRPNSLAALMDLFVSSPEVATPRIAAFNVCAWTRNGEMSNAEPRLQFQRNVVDINVDNKKSDKSN
jgi:hypothetical protein